DDGARAVVVDDWVETAAPDLYLRLGTDLPLLGRDDDVGGAWVLAPSALGLEPLWVPDASGLHEGFLPLTRRNALALVTARMGDPYGWGGVGGGRDCSRLLLDVMATFGVRLGRHSSVQAGSGALTRDVAGLSDEAKLAAIHQAGQLGVVFLYMPGHIMLYLGELDGRPWAASAISEYLVPCAGGGRETVRLDKVEVTTLELGRGTERTAFIERIATLAVFGTGPGPSP
ncbi:MAG: C40 family peptidase, partial [Myxococcales bacterium]|nr:C40 family peptidase [Myxococcales bacterium]